MKDPYDLSIGSLFQEGKSSDTQEEITRHAVGKVKFVNSKIFHKIEKIIIRGIKKFKLVALFTRI